MENYPRSPQKRAGKHPLQGGTSGSHPENPLKNTLKILENIFAKPIDNLTPLCYNIVVAEA